MRRFDVHLENYLSTKHVDIEVDARNPSHALTVASEAQNAADPSTLWIVTRIRVKNSPDVVGLTPPSA